jgi:hypothetical protein
VTGLEATQRPQAAAPRFVSPRTEPARRWWRHWPLALVLAPAIVLRVLAFVAIYPGIWFTDSNGYVKVGATGTLLLDLVSGYGLLVAAFYRLGSAAALIGFQHLLGLAIVVLLYALLVHRGVPSWLAALAVVPVALDAYLLAVEHAIAADRHRRPARRRPAPPGRDPGRPAARVRAAAVRPRHPRRARRRQRAVRARR